MAAFSGSHLTSRNTGRRNDRFSRPSDPYRRKSKKRKDPGELNNTFLKKEEKLTQFDAADQAVKHVFELLDDDASGQLDLNEFAVALDRMGIPLPHPVVQFIFEKIDADDSKFISFQEFFEFINNTKDPPLEFKKEYTAVFHRKPFHIDIGMRKKHEFSLEENDGTVLYVTDLARKELRAMILPDSVLLAINEKDVAGMHVDDVERIIDDLEVSKTKPCELRFIKESASENTEEEKKSRRTMGLMVGDEDWLVLSREMAQRKREARIDKLRVAQVEEVYIADPKVPGETKLRHPGCHHCPQSGTWYEFVHLTFEDEDYSSLSLYTTYFIMTCILISTVTFVLETVQEWEDWAAWATIEVVVSIVFTIEYFARACSCNNTWTWFWEITALIDFLAIVPFWLPRMIKVSGGADSLRTIRITRLVRIFRLLRSPTFKEYYDIFRQTLSKSSSSMGLILTLLGLTFIVFSSFMYIAEEENNPKFNSIAISIWWCVVTMTTVGYGDMYPLQTPGKLVNIFAMFIGLFVIALPVMIIGGHFDQALQRYRVKRIFNDRQKDEEQSDLTDLTTIDSFLDEINETINAAVGILEKDGCEPFFDDQDKNHFVDAGFNNQKKLERLLQCGPHAIHFFPSEIPEYKLFVLYEVFGKTYRKDYNDMEMFSKVRRILFSKISFS